MGHRAKLLGPTKREHVNYIITIVGDRNHITHPNWSWEPSPIIHHDVLFGDIVFVEICFVLAENLGVTCCLCL